MYRFPGKQGMLRLALLSVFLLIPHWAHATTFTFTSNISGGGTFFGSLTFSPDPTPFPFSFPPGQNLVTAYSLKVTDFAPLLPVHLTELNSTMESLLIDNKSRLDEMEVTATVGTARILFAIPTILDVEDADGTPKLGIVTERILLVAPQATIPEPATVVLFATGLVGLAGYRWSQRRREGTQVG